MTGVYTQRPRQAVWLHDSAVIVFTGRIFWFLLSRRNIISTKETNAIAGQLLPRISILPMETFVMPQQRTLADGCRVELQGIVSRPEINGCRGIVIGEFDMEKQRWPVLVMKRRGRDEEMLLRPVNLVLLAETVNEDGHYTETTRVSINTKIFPESSDTSCPKNDDTDSSSSSDENRFKHKLKVSQNLEQPFRSLSGAPLMSFFGSSILFPEDLELKYKVCHSAACPLREGVASEQLIQAFKGITLRECSKCRDTWYCSQDCQVHDWEHGGHRMHCLDNMQLSKAATLESSDSFEESETGLARVIQASKTVHGYSHFRICVVPASE
jgi:hypothetical protein